MSSRVLITFVIGVMILSCSNEKDKYMTYTGTMDVNTVRVSAQTPGQITSLNCEEGSSVARGQLLAVVETEKLGYQIDQSRSIIEELTHHYQASFAQLKAAITNRDNIKTRYERFSALLKSGAATQQSVDDLKAQLDAVNEQLKAADASLAAITSKKKQIESEIKVTQKQLRDANITAPISGTVLVRYVENGELLNIGSPVCDIANLSGLWTKIYLGESTEGGLHSIKLGQIVKVKVDGIADKTFEGTITWISDKSEFTPKTILTEETRTTLVYAAKVTVKNPDGILKIGMPVSVIVEKEL